MPRKRKSPKGKSYEIKIIDPVSAAKIFGVIGLIFGGMAALILLLLGDHVALTIFGTATIGTLQTAVIISLPIAYAIRFAVTALILAWLYNLIAGKVGGLKIQH